MENMSNDNFWSLVENVTFRPIYDNSIETTEKNIDTGDLKYYTENVDNVIESIIINDKFETKVYYKKPMLIKTKPGDKEIIELGDTLLRPKSKQNYSEKDIDKIAELGYN